ncbi:4'-phosphopantetheinyl transferase family protein [Paracoccus sp. T5]|uniref:4'-phosphopantetheinyl transferase family protein n=1 Tax=Paracoccus sp. T5 TaxID=3402161 RepID=UPI003ADA3082
MVRQALKAMMPATVGIGVHRIDQTVPPLLPGEAEGVARAVPGRIREFAAGRAAARLAMKDASLPAAAVPAGPDRAPSWPGGICGSISHAGGLAAALVTRCMDWPSVGLDLEEARPMAADLIDLVVGRDDCLGRDLPRPLAATLLFSAKEAAFKAQFPVTGLWLDYRDVALTITPGAFALTLCDVPLSGSWRLDGQMIVTVMLMSPDQHGALLRVGCPK